MSCNNLTKCAKSDDEAYSNEFCRNEASSIAWRNLQFQTKPWFSTRAKVILNRLNGHFEYHSLNAFIGPSGAGKTTLLNCLNGNWVKGLSPESEIYLNRDQQDNDGKMMAISYFIQQHVEKTIMGKMKVGQILRYAYRFKNGSKGDMERHIQKTVDLLLLDDRVLDRKFKQCSGGEQKRVAIAQELMSLQKPTLLFVDEPTTGLDSNAAYLVIKCLRQLASQHRMTIVTSIHVPSDDILNLFDKLYVLAKGGVCIYSGRPDQLWSHLETQIKDLVIPKTQPPIEVLTKIACSGITDPRVITLAEYALFTEYRTVTHRLPDLVSNPNGVPNQRKLFSFRDFALHLGRMFHVAFVSDIKSILLQLSIGFFYILFLISLFDLNMVKPNGCYPLDLLENNPNHNQTAAVKYYSENSDSDFSEECPNQIQNDSMIRKNVYFLGSICLFVIFVVTCIGSVLSAPFIHMFRNEHRNQWYSLGTFFWSATILGLAQAFVCTIFFSISAYFLSGQFTIDGVVDGWSHINWDRLGNFIFYFIVLAIYFVNIGQLIGTVIYKNIEPALVLSIFIAINFATFSGYIFDVEVSKNILFRMTTKGIRFDSIMKGIVYTIYGLDRCNLDTEYSLAMLNFHVEPLGYCNLGAKFHSIRGVLINVVLIRLLTLAYMHWRFNLTGKRRLRIIIDTMTSEMETINQECRTIQDNSKNNNNNNNNLILITKRDKLKEEIEFERYSRGKILVAWRDLSLYGTRSKILEPTGNNLKNNNLEHSNLERGNLERTNFEHNNLVRENSENNNLENSNLKRNNLKHSNLERGNLERSILKHSNLERGNLERSNLKNSNLERSNLKQTMKMFSENTILHNLNGEFRFGTLNALMGTSGAGKTSLLKVLNGRNKTRLSVETRIFLSKFTRIQTCFITQDVSGHLLPGLTAKQMLVYASRLKNAQLRECEVDISKIDHQQIAMNLLDELGLSDTVDTPVEKCSGGERKRLALALELTALQMPNLICIDEPTSGLDSNSAEVVVACLRKLTQTHSITIITSIHQPNTELLLMFDQIYVLARGGVCVYSGSPRSILSHLQLVSGISQRASKFPIETLIKLSCRPLPDPVVYQLMSNNDHSFVQTIVDSGLLQEQTQHVIDGIQQNHRRFSLEDTGILCLRYLAYIRGYLWKEWLVFLIVIVLYTLFAVNLFDPVIGSVSGCLNLDEDFNNSCSKTEEKILEENLLANNLQYVILAYGLFFSLILIQSVLSIMSEFTYFFNEHRNGWYSSGSFYLTKSLFDTVPIFLLLLPYVYFTNIYESFIPGTYFQLLLIMLLTTIAYQGFAHFVCLLGRRNFLLTSMMVVIIFMLNVMLTNFSVTLSQTHYFIQMLAGVSITNYLLDLLVIVLYGFGRCLPKQIQPIIYLYSLHDSDYYRCLVALILISIVYHTMSVALLVHLANSNQNRRKRNQNIKEKMSKLSPTNTIIPGIGSPNEFRIRIVRFNNQ